HQFKNNILQNPPKKVKLTIKGKYNNINLDIGDYINTKILLQPIPKNNKISSFNFVQYYYFRQIGAIGFVIGEIKKLDQKELTKKDSLLNNIDIKIDYWRYQIANKINNNFKNKDNAAILNALLLGIRDFIPKDLMENIRIAGLAHLLAISGLHLSLAGYIFFIFFRLILSFSEIIALKFNIKKIAAILAILSSFLYLLIAGTPIPALRAFFMVLIVFLAIIFDKNTNPLRSLAFAALIILIINPSSIFEISFQMSFTAILALICFYNIIDKKNNTENIINKNPIKKILSYIIAISLSSTIAQIALAPLVIYYFNNYALLGIISNLVAIPLTTFIIMPISFIYLFSLNSILESPLRYILDIALNNIIKISEFVANIEFSNISISLISSKSLIIIVFGFLLLALSINKKIKYVAMLIILTGALNAYQTPIPDIIIDKNRQFIAIYHNKELFFSKKVRKSIRVNDLLKKTNVKDIKIWDELPRNIANCSYEMCKIKFKNKNILAILKRAKITDICQEDYDILINITKFRLPECVNYQKRIINNQDLKENGSYYLYLD
ncbi:ComEC/Rec2 family competence protein, partial [Rickettsiales bacterium]|nr:ComEC/Rec2 family competence protein [Rickettsiales bacterium]